MLYEVITRIQLLEAQDVHIANVTPFALLEEIVIDLAAAHHELARSSLV